MSSISLVNPDLLEYSYLFPSSLVSASHACRDQQTWFGKIGIVPFCSFSFRIVPSMTSSFCVIEIPYLSILPLFASEVLIEEILVFIVNFFSLDSSQVIFNLSLSAELAPCLNANQSSISLIDQHLITEVTLEFRKSVSHWKNLLDILEKNYKILDYLFNIKIVTLDSLPPVSMPFWPVDSFPDWAHPFNQGFFSSYDSPFNLVLLLDSHPIGWLNAGLLGNSLLFENLWCGNHSRSSQFIYCLIYHLFIRFNDYNLTGSQDVCLFSFRNDNFGMARLTKRLLPFVSMSNNLYKFQVRLDG